MWQRFTERARKVVFYAQEEAQRYGEGYVSTEHLLLGLVRDPDTVAARVLEKLGISLNRVRAETEKQLPRGDSRPSQDMTLTPRAKRVIDLAYDEARNLNNNYIGTEHILLGLIREGDGLAGRVMAKLGATLEAAREATIELQESHTSAGQTTSETGRASSPPLARLKPRGQRSEATEDPRTRIRAKLVFVAGTEAGKDGFFEFLRSLSLVPLSWEQAREFTGKPEPSLWGTIDTAMAVGGAIVFLLSDTSGAEHDHLFTAGLAYGMEPRRTLLVRTSSSESLGNAIEPIVVKIDNSLASRQAAAAILRAAGCPAEMSEESATAGDFGEPPVDRGNKGTESE